MLHYIFLSIFSIYGCNTDTLIHSYSLLKYMNYNDSVVLIPESFENLSHRTFVISEPAFTVNDGMNSKDYEQIRTSLFIFFREQSIIGYSYHVKKEMSLYYLGNIVLNTNFESHVFYSLDYLKDYGVFSKRYFLINKKGNRLLSLAEVGWKNVELGHSFKKYTEFSRDIYTIKQETASSDFIIDENVKKKLIAQGKFPKNQILYTRFKLNNSGFVELVE